MDFAPAYLVYRFFYRIFDFFHHWYIDGSQAFWKYFVGALRTTDKKLAAKISFRAVRAILGSIGYFFITVAFAVAYTAWLAIPIALLSYVATGTL
jgi:hypothetical protein